MPNARGALTDITILHTCCGACRVPQQEQEDAAERHEQQAAVAQRRAECAQEELNRLNDQLAASRRQLEETQEQLAALRRGLGGGMGIPPRGGSASGAGTAASTPGGIHATGTPGSTMLGMAFGQGLGPEPGGVYMLGPGVGPMGQYPYHVATQHPHMATVMQLQAEVERLQVRTKNVQL